MQNLQCVACAGTSSDQAELFTVVIIGVCLVIVVAIATSVFDDKKLGNVVGAIIVLQRASVVGGIAASQFSTGAGGTFFRYLSLINLNIQIVTVLCVAFCDSCADQARLQRADHSVHQSILVCFPVFV